MEEVEVRMSIIWVCANDLLCTGVVCPKTRHFVYFSRGLSLFFGM